MRRGEIWWASMGEPSGSEPGFRRPFLIVSSNRLNESGLATALAIPITARLSRENYPGNVRLPERRTGLSKASVAIVNQVMTINRRLFTERIGRVPDSLMADIDDGLRLVLAL